MGFKKNVKNDVNTSVSVEMEAGEFLTRVEDVRAFLTEEQSFQFDRSLVFHALAKLTNAVVFNHSFKSKDDVKVAEQKVRYDKDIAGAAWLIAQLPQQTTDTLISITDSLFKEVQPDDESTLCMCADKLIDNLIYTMPDVDDDGRMTSMAIKAWLKRSPKHKAIFDEAKEELHRSLNEDRPKLRAEVEDLYDNIEDGMVAEEADPKFLGSVAAGFPKFIQGQIQFRAKIGREYGYVAQHSTEIRKLMACMNHITSQ